MLPFRFVAASLAVVLLGCDERALAPRSDDSVLAVVGGRPITAEDLRQRLAEVSEGKGPVDARGRERILATLIDEAVLFAEAERRGIARLPVGRAAEMTLLAELRIEALAAKVGNEPVSEKDVARYYAEHLDDFTTPEIRRVAAASFGSRELALRARRGGLEGAEEFGETSSDGRGPPRDLTGLPTVVLAAAWALGSVGDVSEPIAHGSRYWLVTITGRIAGETRGIERETNNIRRAIVNERLRRAREDLLASLRKAAPIQVDENLLNELPLTGDQSAYDPADWKRLRGVSP